MYLKKLTLRGFKSFASATSMVFEPGITCIVGPNGSGKSNVVDALAWVMGEQGAKSLRGASMEDVIFAGTTNRAPLGRAEVQLTIDNTDGALPIDYTEVTIARTKFRNGNSEYSINGTPCRLLDVRELLSDSGIGREMHVIVGQGHLDEILSATPEIRRGFIEEAAGVLKHRERKEKALRKLDSTEANLHRLTDLISEIRRQLKPLGRQAEVAKRASTVQAELRDAKARLLADDLVQAQATLAGVADEVDVRERRKLAEEALVTARAEEEEARTAVGSGEAAYRAIQETWFALSGIGERVRSTVSLAQERIRNAEAVPPLDLNPSRDPETLMAQAEEASRAEEKLAQAVTERRCALEAATQARTVAEKTLAQTEEALAVRVREAASYRETAARLSGQQASLGSRLESLTSQIGQMESALLVAEENVRTTQDTLSSSVVPEETDGEDDVAGLADVATGARERLDKAVERRREVEHGRASVAARIEAWSVAVASQQDAGASLVEAKVAGILGPTASLMSVEPGYETAIAASLGAVAEGVAMDSVKTSAEALSWLKSADKGSACMLVAGSQASEADLPSLPKGARYAHSLVKAKPAVSGAVSKALAGVVVVEDVADGAALVAAHPELTAVTRQGDILSSWRAAGGSAPKQSLLHLTSAISAAQDELAELEQAWEVAQAEVADAEAARADADSALEEARTQAREANSARQAALAEHNVHERAASLARNDLARLTEQVEGARAARVRDEAALAQVQESLASAVEVEQPDPSARDQAGAQAASARSAEMEARLGLRTVEERVRSLAGQADSLRKAAETERATRAEAQTRQARLIAAAERARVVAEAGQWLAERVEASVRLAETHRGEIRAASEQANERANVTHRRARELAEQLDSLVDSAHRDELARAQQKMRIDALAERAMAEVGIDVESLVANYGPDQLVATSDPEAELVPYVREEQLKRLRTTERDLQLLGKINPLALEEYDAMQERHNFLSGQLEDLKKTRDDLNSIVDEVDARVQEVFAAAYTDVEREFAATFARLFPGGEGRLVLTEPGEWLTTGVDVEARPAGKKVKRLSLLSGGERSLVAVCFLVSLFKARPSPFYILDEVEAALDDTNLGRLLDIYEELRRDSQLLVITHQKRTMEVADVLYGVTMGIDGTSAVVSQRLRDD
ncbi:MAG: chromosome segregation protein SMC [Propionibacteriaceae bacterium]|jgi:chromosome segregation protein|nr:chromosome segregation protein SMC [Propionibacteriaceae bacterium]